MIPIISTTGTKGKTSVIRAIHAVISADSGTFLRVDTEGAWIDGKLLISHDDSKALWGLAPANSPGRFITLLADKPGNRVAVLENNLFSSKACGLGYSTHSVGVFTNVFEDHMGADSSLQSSEDIAKAKSFIFSRVRDQGYVVFNADDDLVKGQLHQLPQKKTIHTVGCSVAQDGDQIEAEYKLFLDSDSHVILSGPAGKNRGLGSINEFAMYVPGFMPSAHNVLFVIGAVLGHYQGVIDEDVLTRIKQYRPSDVDGRLAIFSTEKGVRIIFDYAHEKQSLKAISELARTYSPNGKVIGVVRLSPTRTDELIVDTAKAIAQDFDTFIVYDKIDGVTRTPDDQLNPFKLEKVGYTAEVFTDALNKAGASKVIKELVEHNAINLAAQLAKPGDTVVYIQGNSAEQSLTLLKKNFGNSVERISQ